MRYLSVCSGIEAASVAWHHLGWEPVGFSEIEPFPAAVLAHHYPNVPNFGDMTKHEQWPITRGAIDLLVGGTPCQSFSVAGLRQGLADPRGNLMLTYLAIADRLRPRWLVWENVPGVLSSGGGRDFGTFLGALGQLGYGFAYRVLDAQYLRVGRWPRAVPQRRRRVFVVGRLIERGARDWAAAGEVLALAEGLQGYLRSRRAKGKGFAADAEGGVGGGCCGTVSSKWAKGTGGPAGDECYNLIAQPTAYRWQNDRDGLQQDDAVAALRASQGASGFHEMNHPVITQPVPFTKAKRAQSTSDDETWVDGQVNPTLSLFDQGDTRATTVAVDFHPTQDPISSTDGSTHCMGTGSSRGDATIAVAFAENFHAISETNTAPSMTTSGYSTSQNAGGLGIASAMTVRRLTPRECERLQGFPDDWTMIPYRGKPPEQCPDGPRYKALGNSMACNCMSWIGERIAAYESQTPNQKEHT
jgi:DNA (cytosine-5)-methyltransferase 1